MWLRMNKAYRKDYTVLLTKPPIGTTVRNHLEGCNYTTDIYHPYVVIGTAGECYVYSYEELNARYELDDSFLPCEISPIGSEVVWVEFHPVSAGSFKVGNKTGNKSSTPHGKGDYQLWADLNGVPDPENTWIVNGVIFNNLYSIADDIDWCSVQEVLNTVLSHSEREALRHDYKHFCCNPRDSYYILDVVNYLSSIRCANECPDSDCSEWRVVCGKSVNEQELERLFPDYANKPSYLLGTGLGDYIRCKRSK